MESGRIQAVKPGILLQILNIIALALSRGKRVYDYTHLQSGTHYVFERIEQGDGGYMTGYGKGITSGDYLLIDSEHDVVKYQVEEISYYANPSDMWTALIRRVPQVKNRH
jgi:MioC protein